MKLRLTNFLCLLTCSPFVLGAGVQNQKSEEQYQQALKLNKIGQYQESAALLKSLMTSYPSIERYKSDYIAVATNAKQCNAVLTYASIAYLSTAPIYVQDAIFSCATSAYTFEQMDVLAKLILSKQGKSQAIEEKLLRLAMEGKHEKASMEWSARLIKDYPNELNAWLLRAQALQDFNQRYAALLIYENLQAKYPKNQAVEQKYIEVLLDMGIPHLALYKINQQKWLASNDQKLKALSGTGAIDIRWSKGDSPVAPDRYITADKAIKTITQALNYAQTIKASNERIVGLQADLLIAYQSRREWRKAIDTHESILNNGNSVPTYALLAAANSYSQLRQYPKAEEILKRLNNLEPNNPETLYDLYYSLIEQDKFAEAKLILDELISNLKKRPVYSPQPHINYSDALIEKSYWEAYQGRYTEAEREINALMGMMPANTNLLKAAGSVAQWQDNHISSAEYFQIAANQDPTDVNAKIGVANARLSSGDGATFNSIVSSLKADYSDLDSVKNAIERQNSYLGGYVTGDFEFGNGTYLGQKNNNRTGDFRVYSPIIDDKYRGFARYRGLNSGPAISADVQAFGGGFQYQGFNQEAEVEVGNFGYSRIEGTQTLNDHWSLNASYERNAFYLLPGALYATTAGNVAGVNANWKDSDTTLGNMGYRYWTLNNNIKQEIFGSITQRLLTQYNYRLDIVGEIGNQQNTNSNVGYFSPINQTEYAGTLNLKVLQWRNTETKKFEFWHLFTGSYGLVTQSGYTALPTNSYGYGQEFKLGEDQAIKWGVAKTSFPFDGQRTSYTTGYLNFEMYFR